ncbi:hypothetical protein GGI23_003750 [Coemansia sp. RSA 2559]|nr:hypothetical protein GGI23_003750 [Coemansia sp. RSA 2559]KAJ2845702.1 hypothetical protein GGI22_006470 [Coemansia erecta]
MAHGNEYNNNADNERGFFKNADGSLKKGHAFETGIAGAAATAFGVHEHNKHERKQEEERRHGQYNQPPLQGQYNQPPLQGQYQQQSEQKESFFRNQDGSINRAHAADASLGAAAAIGATAYGTHEYRKHHQGEGRRY